MSALPDPAVTRDPYEREADMQPVLTDEAIERILACGERREVEAGTVLFSPGDQQTEFVLVLGGAISIEADDCEGTHRIIEHRRGGFTGEIDMFSNRRAVVRAVCTESGEMAFLGRAAFRRMLATFPDLAELIVRAFILRRSGLIWAGQGDLVLLGDDEAGDTLGLLSFLSRNGHPHRHVDPQDEPELFAKITAAFDLAQDDLPAAVWRNETVLRRPSARELADLIGLSQPSEAREVYDVAVVGVGPAGLAAAVNAAAEGLSVIAIEGTAPGGQAGTSSKIENYPAFPTGISGQALGARMMLQAQKFGTEIIAPRDAVSLRCACRPYAVELEDGQVVRAHAVVVASGAKWRRLGVDGEARLENAGVYYGATAVEAARCEDEEVAIVGGGNSAGQAAVFLSRHARRVHMLVREERLSDTMSDYLIRRIETSDRIDVHFATEVEALSGERHLEGVTWRTKDRDAESRDIRHLFVLIGAVPNTDWLDGCLLRDEAGFLVTGGDLPPEHLVSKAWGAGRMPYTGETSRPGVFAVGDVRSGSVKRVASAVGEGAIAAQFLYKVVHEEGHPVQEASDDGGEEAA